MQRYLYVTDERDATVYVMDERDATVYVWLVVSGQYIYTFCNQIDDTFVTGSVFMQRR